MARRRLILLLLVLLAAAATAAAALHLTGQPLYGRSCTTGESCEDTGDGVRIVGGAVQGQRVAASGPASSG